MSKRKIRLIADLQMQEKRSQDEILSTAQENQLFGLKEAKTAGRFSSGGTRARLYCWEGNQRWGQMQAERTSHRPKLLPSRCGDKRCKPKQPKHRQRQISSLAETAGWNHSGDYSGGADALGTHFSAGETREELEQLKRNMGR